MGHAPGCPAQERQADQQAQIGIQIPMGFVHDSGEKTTEEIRSVKAGIAAIDVCKQVHQKGQQQKPGNPPAVELSVRLLSAQQQRAGDHKKQRNIYKHIAGHAAQHKNASYPRLGVIEQFHQLRVVHQHQKRRQNPQKIQMKLSLSAHVDFLRYHIRKY